MAKQSIDAHLAGEEEHENVFLAVEPVDQLLPLLHRRRAVEAHEWVGVLTAQSADDVKRLQRMRWVRSRVVSCVCA